MTARQDVSAAALYEPALAGDRRPRASVLFARPEDATAPAAVAEPESLADLRLDRVFQALTAGREDYELEQFLWRPLGDVEAVRYRQAVVRDLGQDEVRAAVEAFADSMAQVRAHLKLAGELHYRLERERLFLDAVGLYCEAASSLDGRLGRLELASAGLRSVRERLADHVGSEAFASLAAEARRLREELAAVRYAVHIDAGRVVVDDYHGEPDYSAEVVETFARFASGEGRDYRTRRSDAAGLNHVEARILALVAELHPDVFGELHGFRERHARFLDPTLATFDREVQLYLAYLEHAERFERAGLAFCLPHVTADARRTRADEAFDLALAGRLVPEGSEVVTNDFRLDDPERIIVVSGPNQGGKTTFARTFGALHYLAALGLPVPARRARLGLTDRVFTHFERDEEVATLRGKLEDELVRLRQILEQATERSVLVLNESVTATTLDDARYIGSELVERITRLGSRAVYVTFVDELASLNEATVSMVSTVVPEDPAKRTFKVVRRPADGLAYAWAIAEKHGLTYEALRERLARSEAAR